MNEQNIKQQGGTIYINFFDGIDMDRVRLLMNACTKIIQTHKPNTLYFMFASPGGQVDAGIALYNFLKAIPPEITMHNMGAVDSIGTVIFLAGDERYASPNTTFHFHGVSTGFRQGQQANLNQLKEIKSKLDGDQSKIAGIVADNTEMTKAEIKKLFFQGEAKSLDFAKEKGFISDIRPIHLSKADIFYNITIQKQD